MLKSHEWTVWLSPKAVKQKNKLPKRIQEIIVFLIKEVEQRGPWRADWPNYGPLHKSKKDSIPDNAYHCHLQKGKPTFVAWWDVNKKDKTLRFFYVGTHEGSPYQSH